MAYSNKPMRRSALIGPWGVGAIVPFPNDESLMIAGLDMWRYNDPSAFLIKDERLQRRLGVQELRWPPDFRENNADPQNCFLRIPAVRFPTWHYCPYCGSMEKATLYQQQPECDCYPWKNGRTCNPAHRYKRKLIPERFVIICPNGHIDDFPVAEWVHFDSGHKYDPDTCKIRRSTGGASASLSGVYYECTCEEVSRELDSGYLVSKGRKLATYRRNNALNVVTAPIDGVVFYVDLEHHAKNGAVEIYCFVYVSKKFTNKREFNTWFNKNEKNDRLEAVLRETGRV